MIISLSITQGVGLGSGGIMKPLTFTHNTLDLIQVSKEVSMRLTIKNPDQLHREIHKVIGRDYIGKTTEFEQLPLSQKFTHQPVSFSEEYPQLTALIRKVCHCNDLIKVSK